MLNNDVLISIIIPVYKAEDYLKECVESVLTQTYRNIEVILVDDGSPDRCPEICDELALKDKRIKVAHKSNGGAASARNVGINMSSGDYILFLDSDDYWSSENALQDICDIITKSKVDVVCFGYKEINDDTNQYGKGVYEEELLLCYQDNNCSLSKMLSLGIFGSSSCTKAVNSRIIKEKDLFFVEGATTEDVEWVARLLLNIKTFAIYPESFYIYRQHTGSVVHSIKYENLKMLADNIKRCIGYSENAIDEELKIAYFNYLSYQYICFLRVALLCEEDPRTKELLKEMKKYRWLLNYHLNKKVKLVYLFNKFLGYKLMFKALKFYSKVK